MTLTVELTEEETRRVEDARKAGIDVDALIREALGQLHYGTNHACRGLLSNSTFRYLLEECSVILPSRVAG